GGLRTRGRRATAPRRLERPFAFWASGAAGAQATGRSKIALSRPRPPRLAARHAGSPRRRSRGRARRPGEAAGPDGRSQGSVGAARPVSGDLRCARKQRVGGGRLATLALASRTRPAPAGTYVVLGCRAQFGPTERIMDPFVILVHLCGWPAKRLPK